MKKSKILIIASLIFVISIFVSCFLIYNSIFPKAPPIDVPHIDEDMTIIWENPDGTRTEETVVDAIYIADGHKRFLSKLSNAEPTRIMSVNDYPDVAEYYKLSYICEDKAYTYFIYESNGALYAEIPYVGVYEL